VVAAAVKDDPSNGKGVDGAARLLADNTLGATALWLLALGLAAYGAYLGIEAGYRRV
jgi:Domain of Unknown Function (DUF1206)